MTPPTRDRWQQLWRDLDGGRVDRTSWFARLAGAYAEPHRRYHTLDHLAECFRELDEATAGKRPPDVELALWFHDAVYDPRAPDNEEQSAALARECLAETELSPDFRSAVSQLILATKRHDVGLDANAPLMVDVDLSILGQPAERFWEYERQIREEYAWVPPAVFGPKRAEILEHFLRRPRLYATHHFFQKYETQARVNLEASIRKLRQVGD
jgi:predicted metal-dependent HD superfamily phosphohydrolase